MFQEFDICLSFSCWSSDIDGQILVSELRNDSSLFRARPNQYLYDDPIVVLPDRSVAHDSQYVFGTYECDPSMMRFLKIC